NRNYDLSTLFDKELQRTQQTNYEQKSTTEQKDDPTSAVLAKVKELARRQDELLRQQQDLARQRGAMSDDVVKRELERLTREQSELRQLAEELARQEGLSGAPNGTRMRDASQDMRNAASELRRQDPGKA